MWGLLLQCNFVGKAQEVCSSLPLEQSLDYDISKQQLLRAYELVPESLSPALPKLNENSETNICRVCAREKNTL